jgi:hypothetical protein
MGSLRRRDQLLATTFRVRCELLFSYFHSLLNSKRITVTFCYDLGPFHASFDVDQRLDSRSFVRLNFSVHVCILRIGTLLARVLLKLA